MRTKIVNNYGKKFMTRFYYGSLYFYKAFKLETLKMSALWRSEKAV